MLVASRSTNWNPRDKKYKTRRSTEPKTKSKQIDKQKIRKKIWRLKTKEHKASWANFHDF